MKKFYSLILVALLPMLTFAYDAKIDGIYYNFKGDKATVTYQKNEIIGVSDYYYSDYTGSVVIPSTVTYSGKTYTVTSIGDWAFYGCSGLTSVTIPNSVTSIRNSAFHECTSLTSVTIPNSVTSIGECAFACCSSLTSITIPNSVTSISYSAFGDCTSLTSITIPNSVTTLGDGVFMNCTSLTSVTIPNSVTSIDTWTFYNCRSLTSITIPNSVTSIGESAFYKCRSLTSITIPNSVTSIGYQAFWDCSGLISVTIPNRVTHIRERAFEGCNSLEEIYCHAEQTPTVYDNTFKDVDVSDVTLYVPRNSYQQYKEHPIWGKFDIAIGTGIKSLTPTLSEGEGEWFDLSGRKLDKPQRGINIIRYSDGTTKKVKN